MVRKIYDYQLAEESIPYESYIS